MTSHGFTVRQLAIPLFFSLEIEVETLLGRTRVFPGTLSAPCIRSRDLAGDFAIIRQAKHMVNWSKKGPPLTVPPSYRNVVHQLWQMLRVCEIVRAARRTV